MLLSLLLLAGCASPGTPPISAGQEAAPPAPLPAPVQTTQDMWLVSPDDLLQGRTQSGTHYSLHSPVNGAKLSPDGKRVLLHVPDPSHVRIATATWVEVLDLATQQRWRLTPQSDWWLSGWLPDGRIVLVGSRVWLSDPADQTLKDLGETGGHLGYAFDGQSQVAWTTYFRSPNGDITTAYHVHLLNLGSGAMTEFPETYHTRVDQHASAPLVFSPTGDRLAFVDRADGKAHLVIRSVAGGQETRLDVTPTADTVIWNQDGLWIRYELGEHWTVARLDDQGREVQALPDCWPVASPDGLWALTSRYSPAMKAQPGLVSLATGGLRWLDVEGYWEAGWAPGGEMVLVQEQEP